MEVTLYLPYYDYNDGAFDANNDYYNEEDYINAVSNEYNKNKDIVFNSMLDAKNGSGSLVQGSDGQTYKFGQKTSQNEDKVSYSKCEATLYDEDGSDETVDGLIKKFAEQNDFIEMLELDYDTSEEDFETECSIWKNEHDSINGYRDVAGDAWVAAKEPRRDVRMHFKNNADEDVYAVLENCKIMDDSEPGTFIVYVEKISLIDRI